MSFKPRRSNPSTKGGGYESSIDRCNHSISTSLRDLRDQYKDLSAEKVKSNDLAKSKSAKSAQGIKN